MAGINFRPDDLGLRSLIRENNQGRQATAVTPTEAAQHVRSTEERGERREDMPASQYHGPERRRGKDRRKEERDVLLDTRTKRERRRNLNPSYREEEEDIPVRGIDITV